MGTKLRLIGSLGKAVLAGCLRLIAQLLTINISNFEGGRGYAWISICIVVSLLSYLACLITLSILLKRYAKALSTFVVIFGILSIFCLIFFASL